MPKIGKTTDSRKIIRRNHKRLQNIRLTFNKHHKPLKTRDSEQINFKSNQVIESSLNQVDSYQCCSNTFKLNTNNLIPTIIPNQNPEVDKEFVISQKLSHWAINNNIKGTALSSLLGILKQHPCFKDLPLSSRTLLQTPRKILTREIPPGKYCHFNLKNILYSILSIQKDTFQTIHLSLNIDGLPISRSSSQQFWPILGHITELPFSEPFVLGLYFGYDKPKSSNKLLEECVSDIINNPCIYLPDGLKTAVKVHSIVCDAPARSFILNVKGHTGYFGCHKCTVEGDYIQHRMTFPELNCELRTDHSFREQINEEHHLQETSELLKLDINIVRQVPLDYQHLVCLGVVRKLVNLWMKGKISVFRLPSAQVHAISKCLIELKPFFSKEFARKPRSLSQVKNWKATEYRTFILYTGPIVLRNILPVAYYNHFMCLHVAVRILCSKSLQQVYLQYANDLLNYFVKQFHLLYGPENLSYNVHNLIHLCGDSEYYGVLDNFSTFKFENHLGKIKNQIRSGNRQLEQISNIIYECQLINSSFSNNRRAGKGKYDSLISASKGDNVYQLYDNTIIKVDQIVHDGNDEDAYLQGELLVKDRSFFLQPCSSDMLDICFVKTVSKIEIKYSDIKEKGLLLPFNNRFVYFPLLHTSFA